MPSGRSVVRGGVLFAVTTVELLLLYRTEIAPFDPPLVVSLVAAAGAVALSTLLADRRPVLALFTATCLWSALPCGFVLVAVRSHGAGYRTRGLAMLLGTLAAAVLLAALPFSLTMDVPATDHVAGVVFTVYFIGIPMWIGAYRRQRHALTTAGWERAEQIEREHAMATEQAKLRERARIAQDMHDSLGHELSLLAVQAGGLEADPTLSGPQRDTARLLRETSADAMNRLREIVGVLRDDADGAPNQPTDIDTLVRRAAAFGVDVRLERPDAPEPLPPAADRAVYRIVQEGLTNATKHAPGSPVRVTIGGSDSTVLVEVVNPVDGKPTPPGEGRGLIGLAERVRLAGGRLRAGPYRGEFRLVAQLPADDSPIPPAEPEPAAGLPLIEPDALASRLGRQLPDAASTVLGLQRSIRKTLVFPSMVMVVSLLLLAVLLVYLDTGRNSLSPGELAQLEVGARRAELAETLPPVTDMRPASAAAAPPQPAGQTCDLYQHTTGRFGLIPDGQRFVRLCFEDGRLASKEVLSH